MRVQTTVLLVVDYGVFLQSHIVLQLPDRLVV